MSGFNTLQGFRILFDRHYEYSTTSHLHAPVVVIVVELTIYAPYSETVIDVPPAPFDLVPA